MALTGSLAGNVCYATVTSATDAFFTALLPVTLPNGNLVHYEKPDATWMRVESNGAWSFSQPARVPVLPVCDPVAGWADGLAFGGLLLAAVVAAVIFGIIAKAK